MSTPDGSPPSHILIGNLCQIKLSLGTPETGIYLVFCIKVFVLYNILCIFTM